MHRIIRNVLNLLILLFIISCDPFEAKEGTTLEPKASIEKKEYNVDSRGDLIRIIVNSNVNYKYTIEPSWIKADQYNGIHPESPAFIIEANKEYESREGKIIYSFEGITNSIEVVIKQEGATKVESVVLSKSILNLYVGQEVEIIATISPDNAYYDKVEWTSDNTKIISVSPEGIIKALSAGETKIHVTCGGYSEACEVKATNAANCYLVTSPGIYYIPLVKGKTEEVIGDVAKVAVLWESFCTDKQPNYGDIINDVFIENEVIKFSTPTSLQDGNALIAAYDSKGKIVWSWHIWVCSDYIPEQNMCKYVDTNLLFMDRNIGATSASVGDFKALGLLYQWGRKDPFIGPITTSGLNLEKAKSAGNTNLTWISNQYTGTVEYAIENPTTIIQSGYNTSGDWFYAARLNSFWGVDIDLYDPCPYGWSIPKIDSWYSWVEVNIDSYGILTGPYTATNTFDSVNHGMLFDNSFSTPPTWYPAMGSFLESQGFINVGEIGSYWSKDSGGQWGGAYAFRFDNKGQLNAHLEASRASTYPIRCVKQQ